MHFASCLLLLAFLRIDRVVVIGANLAALSQLRQVDRGREARLDYVAPLRLQNLIGNQRWK